MMARLSGRNSSIQIAGAVGQPMLLKSARKLFTGREDSEGGEEKGRGEVGGRKKGRRKGEERKQSKK